MFPVKKPITITALNQDEAEKKIKYLEKIGSNASLEVLEIVAKASESKKFQQKVINNRKYLMR